MNAEQARRNTKKNQEYSRRRYEKEVAKARTAMIKDIMTAIKKCNKCEISISYNLTNKYRNDVIPYVMEHFKSLGYKASIYDGYNTERLDISWKEGD